MICLKITNINGTYLNSEYNENNQRTLINSVLYSDDTNKPLVKCIMTLLNILIIIDRQD